MNNHILIEPLEHNSFVPTDKGRYEEIGTVIAFPASLSGHVVVGDRVYFDAWMAAKYPKGNENGYYWLINWDDVRAIEHEESISK